MIYFAFAPAPALIVVAVLLVSGIAKLRTPDDEAGWAELGVPAALRRHWLMRLHPIAEIVLAAALLALGGVLGVLAAVAATVLFAIYLVMVWRAKQRTPDASCACFGERKPITTRTLLRNGWLVVMAALAAVGVGSTPLLGGVAAVATWMWPWTLGLAAVAFTFVLLNQPTASIAAAAPSDVADEELEDYLRTRTPAVPVTRGDGAVMNLRTLSMQKPILLLSVSETCGSCKPVIERADAYRELLPEASVQLLVRTTPDVSPMVSTAAPFTLHDPDGHVRDSLDMPRTPSAVLLGADGLLAGGPVVGHPDIEAFVGDVYESLHGERPPA
ncbi:MAG: hypothetical protein BGN97_11225 [Microbacterium sp. 69-10]|uniref:MauE/DoxX family redox-associated membrane protein n=1 Tax=Microbacterium sp. 69-10 TaxID=1895783 RepID=UPI00095AA9C3|nr:MauE/DoxX family redox-associated membrane protein [Microbacterium sp. 69-10]OJU40406.1 MAG: hypothetical protein BGN97_11225 [Microbacterium sp. 69-10]